MNYLQHLQIILYERLKNVTLGSGKPNFRYKKTVHAVNRIIKVIDNLFKKGSY